MRKFFKEFKTFITKGNVFDLAVGMIIATAFNKIVSSMVNDIIMPLVTYATGAASLSDLSIPLRTTKDAITGETIVTLRWAYGNFIQTVIDFLIIALSVFIMVKIVTNSRKKFAELNELAANKELKVRRKEARKIARAEKRSYKEVYAELEAKAKAEAEEKARIEAEEKARKELEDNLNNPTEIELLKEIRDALVSNKENKKTAKKPSKE